MKLKIFITKNILEQSKNCLQSGMLGQNCAIGKAIFALFGGISWVTNSNITIYNQNLQGLRPNGLQRVKYLLNLPSIAREFIKEFDKKTSTERVKMTPISFDIDIPEELVEELGLSYIHKVVETEPQLQLV